MVLLGASVGGMLAYEVAARTDVASAVLATCLLDPSDPAALKAGVRFGFLGPVAPTLLRIGSRLAGRLRALIRWAVTLDAMSRDPNLSRLCATDPRGGGTKVPLGWMSSFLQHVPPAPETFTGTAVTLVHPELDTWTPPELSLRFLERIAAPTRSVLLTNCGHFPIEQPGVNQLEETLLDAISAVANR
ncbi:alpha/beta fold hydrolase [Micromonospora sp. NPDC000442]|uniref:alpha/beta fold hydrolase n=1 Tax=Micromonospora sp. NPDC000442 TaxID=3364217 RepID=UPI0036C3B71C